MDSETKKCPACGGEMWDNRPKKASGEFKSTSPDFKCKSCGHVIWPPKEKAPSKPEDENGLATRIAVLEIFKSKVGPILDEHQRVINRLIEKVQKLENPESILSQSNTGQHEVNEMSPKQK